MPKIPQKEKASDPQELVRMIEQSPLPQGKKLALLYFLASGVFAPEHLDELEASYRTSIQEGEAKKAELEAKIKGLDQEISATEKKIDDLTPEAKKELQDGLDQILALAAEEGEKIKQKKTKKAIQTIKTKLS